MKIMFKGFAKADLFEYILYAQVFWYFLFFIFWNEEFDVESNLLKLIPSLADPHDPYNKLMIIFAFFVPLFVVLRQGFGFVCLGFFFNSKGR